MDPPGMSGKARDQELTADRVRRFAVHAGTCLRAGRIEPESLRVDRGSYISRPLHSAVHIITYLVHARDHDHLAWTLRQSRNSV